jgi:hypothetical protein
VIGYIRVLLIVQVYCFLSGVIHGFVGFYLSLVRYVEILNVFTETPTTNNREVRPPIRMLQLQQKHLRLPQTKSKYNKQPNKLVSNIRHTEIVKTKTLPVHNNLA